jgi:hypothetical protein
MPGDDPRGWPRVIVASRTDTTTCLRPLPANPDGSYRLSEGLPLAVVPGPVSQGLPRPLPWASAEVRPEGLVILLPFIAIVVLCLLRGDWVNLARILLGGAALAGVAALLQLAMDSGYLRPGQEYDGEGWYLIGLMGAGIVGWVVLPPLLVYGLCRLIGWRPRWLLWLGPLGLILLFLSCVPLYPVVLGPGEQPPAPDARYLLGAAALALGSLLVLGPGIWLVQRRVRLVRGDAVPQAGA